jgi:hypothetical protein
MTPWKIIALSAIGLIWLGSIVFVAWLTVPSHVTGFRKKN